MLFDLPSELITKVLRFKDSHILITSDSDKKLICKLKDHITSKFVEWNQTGTLLQTLRFESFRDRRRASIDLSSASIPGLDRPDRFHIELARRTARLAANFITRAIYGTPGGYQRLRYPCLDFATYLTRFVEGTAYSNWHTREIPNSHGRVSPTLLLIAGITDPWFWSCAYLFFHASVTFGDIAAISPGDTDCFYNSDLVSSLFIHFRGQLQGRYRSKQFSYENLLARFDSLRHTCISLHTTSVEATKKARVYFIGPDIVDGPGAHRSQRFVYDDESIHSPLKVGSRVLSGDISFSWKRAGVEKGLFPSALLESSLVNNAA